MSRVVIIDSGVANLASVQSAFTALGVESLVTRDPVVVRDADRVVLPGVGRFQSGMERLRESGLDQAVLETHRTGKPLLAICLGMQMLGEGSEESPGIPGLGLFTGRFIRLPSSVRVPHLGWNGVAPDGPSALPEGTAAFANSYVLPKGPEGWSAAWTTHGTRFVSALARGRTLACQFHPELSGDFGIGLLRSWLAGADLSPGASGEQHPGQLAHRL
ncbi:MAG: imidazole glycerol phosphate synthase subunit HisH, partial [Gemmatimonadota bacterium]